MALWVLKFPGPKMRSKMKRELKRRLAKYGESITVENIKQEAQAMTPVPLPDETLTAIIAEVRSWRPY